VPAEVQPTLREMRRLAHALRARRLRTGSLDIASPEVKCQLDARGRVTAIHKRGSTEAYNLIEEFMLQANCAVARRLYQARSPAMYRIHGAPDDEQWAAMQATLRELGVREPPGSPQEINRLLHGYVGHPLEYVVNLSVLRNLKRAVYSATCAEHFGLGFACYTHFTSPIRRYPDLVIHRLLNAIERAAPPPYTNADLSRIAAHCNQTEREADAAETESVDIKRIAYYQRLLNEGDTGPWPGVVVNIVEKGLIVELPATLQRGLLPFSAWRDDIRVNPARSRATGRDKKLRFTLGQELPVRLARVDEYRRRIDFAPAELPRPRQRRG